MSKADLTRRVRLAQLPMVSDRDFATLIDTPYSTWHAAAKHIPDLPVVWVGRLKMRPVQACLECLYRHAQKETG